MLLDFSVFNCRGFFLFLSNANSWIALQFFYLCVILGEAICFWSEFCWNLLFWEKVEEFLKNFWRISIRNPIGKADDCTFTLFSQHCALLCMFVPKLNNQDLLLYENSDYYLFGFCAYYLYNINKWCKIFKYLCKRKQVLYSLSNSSFHIHNDIQYT